ncbi:hypothetical protein HKX42_03120 [Salinisphaera sp. USBA-960]|uniref:tetratricopeptide repeat protein n=1 Tax=Salinisphaera orenii TaxID=856731 RepID=UPI000DBEA03B|nr:hypothetical protein [Salifodinibacter halophilus]NNC25869.1 hypothetical protein [Salifodinibacter halophilus]
MRKLATIVFAGLLMAGCATDKPSLPPGGGNAPPPQSSGDQQTDTGSDSKQTGEKIGHADPLERGHAETSGSRIGGGESSTQSQDQGPLPPKRIKANASSAVMSLVNKADKAMANEQTGRAGSLIQRALNLSPRNPFLYQRLAAIRLVQDKPGQAVQLARKSNSLASNNPFVKTNNWQLIAEAQKNQGQKGAAHQAVLRANKFKRIGKQYQQ